MGSTAEHQKLVNDVHLLCGAMPQIRLWKQVNGVFRSMTGNRLVKVGLIGSSDLTGIILTSGKRLEAEAKTGNAVQNDEQIAFANMIVKYGGVFILFHSVDEFLDKLQMHLKN